MIDMARKETIESMGTNLKGRLKNTSLPRNKALFSLFEAVVNSIHSIDERLQCDSDFFMNNAKIEVTIEREPMQNLENNRALEEVCGFVIIDNGIGFNDSNYQSFKMLDSEYKARLGCKGIGRLTWLKVFNSVHVSSRYRATDDTIKERTFDFLPQTGITNLSLMTGEIIPELSTTIRLSEVNPDYHKTLPKSTQTIAHQLLEHCIWYFLRDGGAPEIIIKDEGDMSSVINLMNEYENYMSSMAQRDSFSVGAVEFDITHLFVRSSANSEHTLSFCAADRTVINVPLLNKVVGLFGPIDIEGETYIYKGYVTSDFLSNNVSPARTSFNIPNEPSEMFRGMEITMQEISRDALQKVSSHLSKYLEGNIAEGRERLNNFIATKAPRYQVLMSRLTEEELVVNPQISDKELDLKLYGHLSVLERQLMADGHDLMTPGNIEEKADYTQRIENYLSKVVDIKRSDLANYITHRKVIIDLLEKAIQVTVEGKYEREDVIHKLIIPMIKESSELRAEDSNLWIINEGLAFHDYLASDKPFESMSSVENNSSKEPDILTYSLFDNPLLVTEPNQPMGAVTIVELKRPMRNDFKMGEEKDDPIEQALSYLERIREGKVKLANGRVVRLPDNIPGFCYIIGDLTPRMEKCCRLHTLTLTNDNLGYFGYNPNYKAYIEVISFERLIKTAKQRNRAFFDKLGLPTT